MKLRRSLILVTALAMSASASAQYGDEAQQPPPDDYGDTDGAQDSDSYEEQAPSSGYPANFTQRPITLPAMTLKADVGFGIIHTPSPLDNGYLLNLGAAFGIMDDLEVGISGDRQGLNNGLTYGIAGINSAGLVPLVLAPDFDYGDIYFYGRYRILKGENFELGAELGFNIPIQTDFGLVVAVPFRARLGDMFSIDGGLEFLTIFTDPDATFAMRATVQPRFAPVDFLYVGLDLGIGFGFTSTKAIVLPLGFEAGYVIDLDSIKIDAFVNFSFPALYQSFDTGPMGRQGDSVTEIWQLFIGGRAFIGLGD